MQQRKPKGLTLRGGIWHINTTIGGRAVRESTGCREGDITGAQRKLDERRQALTGKASAQSSDARERTFAEAAAEYVMDLQRQGKDSVRADIDIRMVLATVGCLPLSHVHQRTLQPWIDAQDGQRASGTVARTLRTVAAILTYAARVLRDGNTPWLSGLPPKLKAPDWGAKAPRPITWEEQDALADALPASLVAPVLFAVFTGARDAEVTHLRWDMERPIDGLPGSAWWIPPEVRKTNARKTHSEQAGRFVVCNRMARAVIEGQRGKDSEWVFPSPRGGHYDRMNNKGWRAACKAVNLAIRVHDLRHTFGGRARDAGIEFGLIKSLLGHDHSDITAHYSVPGLRRLLAEAEKIERPIVRSLCEVGSVQRA